MRYLGGKFRVSKHIAEVVNQHDGNVYLEPFMGSCWVTRLIKYKHRIAGDVHEELVEMFRKLQEGWEPPDHITKEEYDDIRANKIGKYPKELVAFAGFGCAFAGSYFRKYAGEIHPARSKRSVLKKIKDLMDVHFFVDDYRNLKPKGCIIYCDPPYEDSYGFRITGVIGNGKFDNDEFWDVMRSWSKDNVVYISENKAPDDFECVLEVPVKSGVRTTNGCETRIERLFHKPTDTELLNLDIVEPKTLIWPSI